MIIITITVITGVSILINQVGLLVRTVGLCINIDDTCVPKSNYTLAEKGISVGIRKCTIILTSVLVCSRSPLVHPLVTASQPLVTPRLVYTDQL